MRRAIALLTAALAATVALAPPVAADTVVFRQDSGFRDVTENWLTSEMAAVTADLSRPDTGALTETASVQTSGGGDIATAALWVSTGGGPCTRLSPEGAYDAAKACDNWSEAWTACQSGDTVGVKGGTYSSGEFALSSGAARAAGCKFIGVDSETITIPDVVINNTDKVEAAYIDGTTAGSVDIRNSDDVTYRNSVAHVWATTFRDPGFYIEDDNNLLIQDVEIDGRNDIAAYGDGILISPTGVSGGDGEANGTITLRRVYMHSLHDYVPAADNHQDCVQAADVAQLNIYESRFADCSTQTIFVNGDGWPYPTNVGNVTIENTFLGTPQSSSGVCVFNAMDDLVMRNNTVGGGGCNWNDAAFRGDVTITGNYFGSWGSDGAGNNACQVNMAKANSAGSTAANNARPGGATTCGGQGNIVNVPTSAFVDFGGAVSDDLHLAAGANALVDAMTTSYTTTDVDQDTRPCGANGDIGADERC